MELSGYGEVAGENIRVNILYNIKLGKKIVFHYIFKYSG